MLKILNLLFFAGMVVMNYLANALPLNGKTTGELSDAFPNLFVPAGVTFSIWGIIYILLLAFCIVQFSGVNEAAVTNISWSFAISCLLNALWIVCWHYGKIPLSVIVMLGLLATLIYVNLQLKEMPTGIIKASFGIYLGWICIATIASVTTLLVHTNWNGFGIPAEIWTIVMIIIGALITAFAITRFNNYFIGLSVVWAFIGIIIKRHGDYRSITITAALAALVVGIIVIRSFILKKPVM
jgi:hypothetical protein